MADGDCSDCRFRACFESPDQGIVDRCVRWHDITAWFRGDCADYEPRDNARLAKVAEAKLRIEVDRGA